ncbi:hypothetical protein ACSBR2_039978 [Camellia fascicularis]
MKSLATSLSWASLAMGYYLSIVIVSIVNSIRGSSKHCNPWLSGSNLNHYHLDRFYWLMCVLSGLNFLHYLSGLTDTSTDQKGQTSEIIVVEDQC